ncbi:MAG: alginate export family protein, partial [Rectinemataceae bacterium]|nr:alginate export family protein [Rectinemataceae bacterium]
IRATLDFDPWTVDVVYAKINETGTAHADHDLTGANVAYKFDEYNSKAEGYYWFSRDDSFNSDLGYIDPVDYQRINALTAVNPTIPAFYADTTVPGVGARRYEENRVHVVGLRGDIEPVENLMLSGEGAYQWGRLNDLIGAWNVSTDGSSLERKRSAWAVDLKGDYLWKDVSYKPSAGLGYVFLSGNKSDNGGKFKGWDPMFKGKFYSLIRDYQHGTGTALNNIGGNIYQTLDYRAPSGSTNSHTLYVDGGLKPMDDLSIKARYLHFWAAERASVGSQTRGGRNIGDEIDTCLVYDYTEDVQFDLTGGIFLPGKLFDNNTDALTKGNDAAVIVTGGVKVVF